MDKSENRALKNWQSDKKKGRKTEKHNDTKTPEFFYTKGPL